MAVFVTPRLGSGQHDAGSQRECLRRLVAARPAEEDGAVAF